MKLTCTQENFKRAVYNTERVTGKQSTLPILNNILLETEKGRLKLSATNLEIGAIAKIGAKVETDGRITVPAKILSNFVNNLPANDTIELEERKQTLVVKSGNYRATIKGLDPQDFPIIPRAERGYLFSLSATEFKDVMSRLLVCVSPNETRPELSGVNLIFTAEGVYAAATDSFRLAEAFLTMNEIEHPDEYRLFSERTKSVIVPASTISEVLRIVSPDSLKVRVAVEESQIFFEVDTVEVVSRLINGKYPEYKQIIPKEFGTRVVLPKDDLLRAVKVSSIFAKNQAAGEVTVKINSEERTVTVCSQSQEAGDNETVLKADIVGPSQEIVFNPRYLGDGLNAIPTSQVAFLAINPASPAAFKMIDSDNGEVAEKMIYIVMPIKN